jgi:hypothetical protein
MYSYLEDISHNLPENQLRGSIFMVVPQYYNLVVLD